MTRAKLQPKRVVDLRQKPDCRTLGGLLTVTDKRTMKAPDFNGETALLGKAKALHGQFRYKKRWGSGGSRVHSDGSANCVVDMQRNVRERGDQHGQVHPQAMHTTDTHQPALWLDHLTCAKEYMSAVLSERGLAQTFILTVPSCSSSPPSGT